MSNGSESTLFTAQAVQEALTGTDVALQMKMWGCLKGSEAYQDLAKRYETRRAGR